MPLYPELCAALAAATGEIFVATHARPVGGGDIAESLQLADGQRAFFVKRLPLAQQDVFDAEADGLAALGAHLRVPQVYASGLADGRAFLALEMLTLRAHGDAARLGGDLARLHRAPFARFGWARDNWIGATPQANEQADDWVAFWRHERLGALLRRAAANGHTGALQRDGERLMADLSAFFADYTPAPSLLHGDLWGGNHGYLPDGVPVLFDPAVYVGDRECDLAMTELFGGFDARFVAAYREAYPLDPGYRVRKSLYNLYHVLNHAVLFGGGYAAQAARMAAQLVAELR